LIAFIQALSDLGWKNTKNVQIETCWGAGDTGRFHQCAAEIVALAPDVILAADGPIKVVFTLPRHIIALEPRGKGLAGHNSAISVRGRE
jgi:hypothetical protein